MKKILLLSLVTLFILSGLGVYSFYVYKTPAREPPQTVLPEEVPRFVKFSGKVVPLREARLSFPIAGRIAKVYVQEGEQVKEGTELVSLEDSLLRIELAMAEAELEQARLELEALKLSPDELSSAELELQEARALVEEAKAELAAAQAELRIVEAGPSEEELRIAKAEMDRAEAIMRQAQAEYDKVAWAPGTGASPQAIALEQATLNYELAKARYEALLKGPSEDQKEIESSKVKAAYARLRAAEAKLYGAQTRYNSLKDGVEQKKVALAETKVKIAELKVQAARLRLEQATLKAPFSGVVWNVWKSEGEGVSPGDLVITMGDASALKVVVTGLSQEDLKLVKKGQEVAITIPSLSNLTLPGKIESIVPSSSSEARYNMYVRITAFTPQVRWGMTAIVVVSVR
jgi:multidrug efflux pump subunit AcrA (membrane-fusion protein)